MGDDTALAITIEGAGGGGATVALTGELDIVTAPEVCEAIEALTLDGVTTIVVDVAGVRFIDSTGLGALVALFKRCVVAGGELVVANPRPNVLMLLEISGLTQVLPIRTASEPSLEAAS